MTGMLCVMCALWQDLNGSRLWGYSTHQGSNCLSLYPLLVAECAYNATSMGTRALNQCSEQITPLMHLNVTDCGYELRQQGWYMQAMRDTVGALTPTPL